MREYLAKQNNMEIEVTTVDGEKVILKTAKSMSASLAMKVTDKWNKYQASQDRKQDTNDRLSKLLEQDVPILSEEERKEIEAKIEKNEVDHIVLQSAIGLSILYSDKKAEWFLENLDMGTMNDILKDSAEAMTGLETKKENSN